MILSEKMIELLQKKASEPDGDGYFDGGNLDDAADYGRASGIRWLARIILDDAGIAYEKEVMR